MSNKIYEELAERIDSGSVRASVVGLGYAGLPLAMAMVSKGIPVVGYDTDLNRVSALVDGVSYIADVPSETVQRARKAGLFQATTEPAHLAEADVIHICVPTPLSKSREPDLSYVLSATRTIADVLRVGHLIILESTTYPGTTEELVLPYLEAGRLHVGKDFFLAYSPERIDPGNTRYHITNTPKIVGGVTPDCTALAVRSYRRFIDTVLPVSSTGGAEMVKLVENTFRSVNIALANEISLLCDRLGLDVWEIIDAAATKPFGFMPFYPGPGLGGHCIPVDPHYLAWRAKELQFHSRFIELATEINASMPYHVVRKVSEALNERKKPIHGSQILVLGVAYKENVGDVRESPALDVMTLLLRQGAQLIYYDPHVPQAAVSGKVFDSYPQWTQLLDTMDAVVILTHHRGVDYAPLLEAPCPIIDTRGTLRRLHLLPQESPADADS